jgi:hypothetical protein
LRGPAVPAAVAVVVHDSAYPNAAMRRRRKVGENGGVLDRDLLLVVVAIRDPGLHLRARKRPGEEALMEWVLIVISFRTDCMQPVDETTLSRRSQGEARLNTR